jgi:hypothetical protein
MQCIRPRPIFAWSSDLPAVAPCLQALPPPMPGPHLPLPTPTLLPLPCPQPQLLAPLTSGSCLLSSTLGPHSLPLLATLPSLFSPGPHLAVPMPTLPPMPKLQLLALPMCSHLPQPLSLPPATDFQMPPQIQMSGFCLNVPPTLLPAAFALPPLCSKPISGVDNFFQVHF